MMVWPLDALEKEVFECRAFVMWTVLLSQGVSKFSVENGMKQIISGREAHKPALVSRAWKFLMLFRRFLYSAPGGR